MGKTFDLVIPTINVNDDSVTIGNIEKDNLEYIEKGEVLYCVETSKAAEDYSAEMSGYVVLYVEPYDEVKVGESAGMIFEDLEEAKAKLAEVQAEKEKAKKLSSINASKKALEYAESIDFDITLIRKNGIIKKEDIDAYLSTKGKVATNYNQNIKQRQYRGNDMVIVGAGGLSLMLIDAIKAACSYNIIGIVDDYAKKSSIVYGYKILGSIDDMLPVLYEDGLRVAVNAVSGMSSNPKEPLFFARNSIAEKIRSYGYIIPNIIHPKAIIESSCVMGDGNIILSGANIGSNVSIGNNCYINTNTMVSHECKLGDGVKIAPGAILAGRIEIGDNTLIGMGSTVYMNLSIGKNVVVYNGIDVFSNISDNKVVNGNKNIQ